MTAWMSIWSTNSGLLGVVCTGLFDDETETPEDYAASLRRFRARDLPFICANPDIVVERGDRLIWCAGALARDYTISADAPSSPASRIGRSTGGAQVACNNLAARSTPPTCLPLATAC